MSAETLTYKVLAEPQTVSDAGLTGSYVDIQGIIGDRKRLKAILVVADGTTPGDISATIGSCEDTSGTDEVTVATFSTIGDGGGDDEQHLLPNTHRYIRFLGDAATGKDMILCCVVVGEERYA